MSKQQAQKPFDPSTFMAAFDGGVTASTYGEGQLVFSQGAPADAVFYIQNGKVKLSVVSDQGKEAVVAFLEAGDFCGEGCLAGQLVRMATAMAATECTIVRVAKPSMITHCLPLALPVTVSVPPPRGFSKVSFQHRSIAIFAGYLS